ncbi:hypothetical protein BOX15_Mlig001191g2 [Macrostomum lignano]|uniref:Uncharacterized protein n=1 Tax=Macrostomum lignano TaxID=282301 RepID=A0A267ESZ8_9PLAT|nr:hypothetical protein BOX15_Mlig001191g2 [Macrostomum lignano]
MMLLLTAAHREAEAARWLGHVRAGRLSAVARSLGAGDLGVDTRAGPNGNTGLHEACAAGCFEVAAFLIGRGAKLDAANDWGSTPLHMAVGSGHLALVRLLIERGACLDRADSRLGSPLHYASAHNQPEAAILLASAGADLEARCRCRCGPAADTPLAVACSRGHCRVAEVLLAFGAAPPRPMSTGQAPLAAWTAATAAGQRPEQLTALARRAVWRRLRQLGPTAARQTANWLPCRLRDFLCLGLPAWPWPE